MEDTSKRKSSSAAVNVDENEPNKKQKLEVVEKPKMELINLNNDCLKEIFQYLSPEDLVNVVDSDDQFLDAAQLAFEISYGKKTITVNSAYSPRRSIEVLNYFGPKITKLKVFYEDECSEMGRAIVAQCPNLLLPKIRTLEIFNQKISMNENQLGIHYPTLRHFVCDGEKVTSEIVLNLCQWNPQLTGLFLSPGIEPKDLVMIIYDEFISRINKMLPDLEILYLDVDNGYKRNYANFNLQLNQSLHFKKLKELSMEFGDYVPGDLLITSDALETLHLVVDLYAYGDCIQYLLHNKNASTVKYFHYNNDDVHRYGDENGDEDENEDEDKDYDEDFVEFVHSFTEAVSTMPKLNVLEITYSKNLRTNDVINLLMSCKLLTKLVLRARNEERFKKKAVAIEKNIEPLGIGWELTRKKCETKDDRYFGLLYTEGIDDMLNFIFEKTGSNEKARKDSAADYGAVS